LGSQSHEVSVQGLSESSSVLPMPVHELQAATGQDDEIDAAELVLPVSQDIACGPFDPVAVYRQRQTLARHRQTQARVTEVIGARQYDQTG
jgi:hypothetical protein